MIKQHAKQEVIGRGAVMPMHPDETGESAAPQVAHLYLDDDAKYRWYEEGRPTEAEGASLRTAVEAARLRWPKFQLMELDGHAVSMETQTEIPERFAADEVATLRGGAQA
jgi:hypothetical protein